MDTQVKKKRKVKGVRQKLKLFRSNEPLKSVLMWSVNHSINQLSHVPSRAILMADDFKAYMKIKVDTHLFNKDTMPGHFKLKEYCPMIFKHLRQRFGVEEADFLESFTKRQPVWDDATGRSGSKFLLTYNYHYIIKTITSEEVEAMHHVLSAYYSYIVEHDAVTLLPQYIAMYRLTIDTTETYLLVMRNLFSPRLKIHRKYDLKGSTVDREASEKEKNKELPTFKDNDLINDGTKVYVGEEEKQRILSILTRDVDFLQNGNMMDYSLLVGIHDLDQAAREAAEAAEVAAQRGTESGGGDEPDEWMDSENSGGERDDDGKRPHSPPAGGCPTPPDSPFDRSFRDNPFNGELDIILEKYGIKSCDGHSEKCIYFIGLIDVLTKFGMRKRTAQTYKAVKHGAGAEVSTVKPDVYAKRFLDFIAQALE